MARIGSLSFCLWLVGCFEAHDPAARSDAWEACTDAGPVSDSGACRHDGECPAGSDCVQPDTPLCRGECIELPTSCGSSDECPDGAICDVYFEPCACGFARRCVDDCRRVGCGEGDVCEDATGFCRPLPCTEGYACPPNTECISPGSGSPGDHGCARVVCASDEDCECGACIHRGGPSAPGFCHDGPGFCLPVDG